jgi:hypothetical protein
MRRGLMCAMALLVCGACAWMGGCADETQQKPADRASDRALADPFNYSPDMEKPDISGGDTAHFDKDAFKRDVDDVVNP